ncbi:MAG: rhomboid family intramembrane serine protease [Bacillota bacterium]|jgi:rhomboid protease GluP|nr:rhomboid family intramembrane serine protease [Bacillota bacterium]HOO30013.1 rhomboid family intramembrane serine protease [Bacillota bacterium]HPZ14174.1 rhomboid family intramembrane serine protease [Bacillota bacterium]HQD79907.1 rhomboid family intramembrane serine protease [Bacillota bacterium]
MSYPERPLSVQRTAPATYTLLVINAIMFGVLEAAGGSQNPFVLLKWGAKFAPAIRAGEAWRLATSVFLHSGLLHLAANSYSLYNLGNVTERLLGTRRFTIIYFLSGIWGSIISTYLSDPMVLGVGASGAIFGLAGCLFYFGVRYPKHFAVIAGSRFILVVLLNLIIGFTNPLIDNYAHIGGLFGGFVAACAFGLPNDPRTETRTLFCWLFIVATLIAIAMIARPLAPGNLM